MAKLKSVSRPVLTKDRLSAFRVKAGKLSPGSAGKIRAKANRVLDLGKLGA